MRLAVLIAVFALAGCGAAAAPVRAPVAPNPSELPLLLEAAARGEQVGDKLRLLGPEGLATVIRAYDAERDPIRQQHLSHTMDEVAQQKDAKYTRLYWYTDLAEAEAASRASGKPILSLRLLGKLDEELSCANSRFFRTALYPNREVREMLKDKFVLHWSSERPAPVMTIDFGDGRQVKRTVTGNSIHYVLDADGRIVDAIPGLLGPGAFVEVATKAHDLAKRTAAMSDREAALARAAWHQEQLTALRAGFASESSAIGLTGATFPPDLVAKSAPPGGNLNAAFAMPSAMSKAMVERPVVVQITPTPAARAVADSVAWDRLAPQHADACRIDAAAQQAMRDKHTMRWQRTPKMFKAAPHPLEATDFAEMESSFEQTMALDTVRNEYMYHALIHGMLSGEALSFERLNARVYDEIFATPASDPWLGLVPPNAYSGIADDGIVR